MMIFWVLLLACAGAYFFRTIFTEFKKGLNDEGSDSNVSLSKNPDDSASELNQNVTESIPTEHRRASSKAELKLLKKEVQLKIRERRLYLKELREEASSVRNSLRAKKIRGVRGKGFLASTVRLANAMNANSADSTILLIESKKDPVEAQIVELEHMLLEIDRQILQAA